MLYKALPTLHITRSKLPCTTEPSASQKCWLAPYILTTLGPLLCPAHYLCISTLQISLGMSTRQDGVLPIPEPAMSALFWETALSCTAHCRQTCSYIGRGAGAHLTYKLQCRCGTSLTIQNKTWISNCFLPVQFAKWNSVICACLSIMTWIYIQMLLSLCGVCLTNVLAGVISYCAHGL